MNTEARSSRDSEDLKPFINQLLEPLPTESSVTAQPLFHTPAHRGDSASSDGVTSHEAILASLRALQLQQRPPYSAAPPPLLSPFQPQNAGTAAAPLEMQQQRKEVLQQQISRTVYINYLDRSISEQQLAAFFAPCGTVADVRISSGDTSNSSIRFGFVEFVDMASAARSLSMNGQILGRQSACISPSKTAITPVKNEYLPRSQEEQAAVFRTVYVSNIHFTITSDSLQFFFTSLCGPVAKLRLLRDSRQNTKFAFVEFNTLESAAKALACNGKLLGPLKIRVSPSKTPVKSVEA